MLQDGRDSNARRAAAHLGRLRGLLMLPLEPRALGEIIRLFRQIRPRRTARRPLGGALRGGPHGLELAVEHRVRNVRLRRLEPECAQSVGPGAPSPSGSHTPLRCTASFVRVCARERACGRRRSAALVCRVRVARGQRGVAVQAQASAPHMRRPGPAPMRRPGPAPSIKSHSACQRF